MASAGCRKSRERSPRKKKFDIYPIGFFHIDLAEVRTAEGKLYLFVAIDRTSKFAVVELVEKAARENRPDMIGTARSYASLVAASIAAVARDSRAVVGEDAGE